MQAQQQTLNFQTQQHANFANVLNTTLEQLQWNFMETNSCQYLEINGSELLAFDNSKDVKGILNSPNWIRSKHNNQGIHEPATVAAFVAVSQAFQEKVETVFDIGSLYGYFSILSSSLFPNSNVVAFEMNRNSHKQLNDNINLNRKLFNRNIAPVNVGLSDVSNLSQSVLIDGFVLNEDCTDQVSEKASASVIDILTLDKFCSFTGAKPSLIKLDVEGYQAKIVPGALETITENKPAVIMEFDHISRMQELECTNREIADYFFDLGYKCWWIADQRMGSGTFEEISSEDIDMAKEINSLAVFVHSDWL